MHDNDATDQLEQQITQAIADKQAFNIRAGGSKDFIGRITDLPVIDVSQHRGVVAYEPTELVLTARAGTPLNEIADTLAEHGQKLAFEPPVYNGNATLGGTVAAAVAGPARPYLGGVRDHVLGCRVINGHGHVLRFGGEVMKNVAGYDVTRLMTGAMGTLGLLLDISLKVVPIAEQEVTLQQELDLHTALPRLQQLAGESPLVSASAWYNGAVYIRLAGVSAAVESAVKTFGGEQIDSNLWSQLNNQQHAFFEQQVEQQTPLWRISVPPLTPELDVAGTTLYDWAGTQRWCFTEQEAENIRAAASAAGGHAQLFKAQDNLKRSVGAFHPQTSEIMNLHRNIKNEFDPHSLFNPGRLYDGV